MSLFSGASILLVPSGYKENKLYSIIPSGGTGDFTWTRASNGTRINSSNVIETMGNNVPRLTYEFDSCPGVWVEGSRTNLVSPSDTATTQTITVTSSVHTLSFYGTGNVTLSGATTNTLNGTGVNNRVTLTFTPTAGSLTLTVSGTVTNWQLETGSFASTLIPTTTITPTATRTQDINRISGATSLIGQTEGVVFIDMYFYTATTASFRTFFNFEGTVTNTFSGFSLITSNNGNNITFGGGYNFSGDGRYKISALYNASTNTSKLFVNGAEQSSSTFAGFTNTISQICIGARLNPFSNFNSDRQGFIPIFTFALFKTALTDEECRLLTT